jgi:CheY-like chemotaxis protein
MVRGMPLEEHNNQLRAVIQQNQRTLERMQHLLAALEDSISSRSGSNDRNEDKVILIVDDNPHDAYLLEHSMQRMNLKNRLQVVPDGAEAITYLKGEGMYHDRVRYPLPLLLFLDLKMPSIDGFAVLDWLQHHPQYATFPVVVMSGTDEVKQVNRAYHLGARSFLTKPINVDEIKATLETFHIPVAA